MISSNFTGSSLPGEIEASVQTKEMIEAQRRRRHYKNCQSEHSLDIWICADFFSSLFSIKVAFAINFHSGKEMSGKVSIFQFSGQGIWAFHLYFAKEITLIKYVPNIGWSWQMTGTELPLLSREVCCVLGAGLGCLITGWKGRCGLHIQWGHYF